ncbi:MAG: tetratricopeptide repeat-containing sensor histidine kinase [Taibaiella sp.]|nr:tetratricopeptide repeat-containing sensor histidine kinase [Taibaiella sp.]
MKNRILLLILSSLLITKSNLLAQRSKAFDSLTQLAKTLPDDSIKLGVYDQIFGYVNTTPVLVKPHINDAIKLSQKLKSKGAEMTFFTGSGKLYYELGDYDNALKYYLEGAKVAESAKDYAYMCEVYTLISDVYIITKNFQKSDEYLAREWAIIQRHFPEDDWLLASYYSKKSRIFNIKNDLDSALHYAWKVANITKKTAHRSTDEAKLHVNDLRLVGITYTAMAHYKEAEQIFAQCKAILDTVKVQSGNAKTLCRLYGNIGDLMQQKGNYREALAAFDQSLRYAREIEHPEAEMNAYLNLSKVYNKQQNYKEEALFLKKYYELKDSLYTTDKQVKMTELEADYQLEKKNATLALQRAETARQKNLRNISVGIAFAMVLVLGALIVLYRRIRSKNKLLAEQNEQILEQKEALEKLNTVKDKMFSVISHDLRNPIQTLKTYFALTKQKQLGPEKQARYQVQMEQSVIQTGTMMDNLLIWAQMQLSNKPPQIFPIDTADAIKNALAEVAAQAQLKDIFFEEDITEINALANKSILEIAIRNLLTNAIKFSKGNSSIKVFNSIENEKVIIRIQDFGVGMDALQIAQLQDKSMESQAGTQGEKGSGMGLILVIQLLQQINAHLDIQSSPGKGSIFAIILPKV